MISSPNNFFTGGGNLAMLDENLNLVRNTSAIIANAVSTMRHDEQVLYDREMIEVARNRMTISNLFRELGLIKPLGGLGVILSMYQQSGDFTSANISMSGRTRADQDKLTFNEAGVPIPIFHKEFELDHRRLLMSRRLGQPLDTDSIAIASRKVLEEWESHLFAGIPSIVLGGQVAYGLTTHPSRNTLTLTASWTSTTGANILIDVNRMVTALQGDNYYGPYVLIVAKDIWLNLTNDYSTSKGDNTILQRIQAHPNIKRVECADYLTNGNVVMFQPTKDVVDLAIAQDLDNIPWQTQPMQTEYKVFMAGAIRVKSEFTGKSGVVHGTP